MRYAVRAAAALLLLVPAMLPAAGPGDRAPADPANRVVIDNFTFRPATLTVKAGTKVTWVNRDDVPHTATSSAKPRLFNSGTLDTDEQFSFTFTTAGTYEYFCTLHPRMTGKVVVK
jgi:plastocyanin